MLAHKLKNEMPAHTDKVRKGEERVSDDGQEPGRHRRKRTARDATSINPRDCGPIDPSMPHIPPA